MAKKTLILVILDGWGIGRNDATNPIYAVQPPTINQIKACFPCGALEASGIAVGLPWGETGNSEVGHLTIGAGKTLYQHFPRISMAIKDGSFFKNEVLLAAIDHAKKNAGAVNLVGIISESNVHASRDHLNALLKLAAEQGAPRIQLHLFADGKDSSQKSFLTLLESLHLEIMPAARLASVSGRYYAMDRDQHWDRTALCYAALTSAGATTADIKKYVEEHYQKGLIDEFIQPVIIGPNPTPIADNDAIIFFNYREDSIRQIAEPFTNPQFAQFKIMPLKNTVVITLTRYVEKSDARVAFPTEAVTESLGATLASHGKNQLRIAETEKYAHVTYFFNGLQEAPYTNEYRVLIPSQAGAHTEEHPEMMAREITNRILQAIDDGEMDCIVANYANADMIAHTGNYDAAVQAVRVIDHELERLVKSALDHDAILLITADHGNVEQMIDPTTGLPEAKHNPSAVPVYLVTKQFERINPPALIAERETESMGLLSDVAPTILELLDIPKPASMTGESLLKKIL